MKTKYQQQIVFSTPSALLHPSSNSAVESVLLVPVPWRPLYVRTPPLAPLSLVRAAGISAACPQRYHPTLTQLGEGLFAHMPRLHAFVFSGGYMSRNMYARYRIHIYSREFACLEAWQFYVPALCTVGFTHRWNWVMTERGWESDDEQAMEWLEWHNSGGLSEDEED